MLPALDAVHAVLWLLQKTNCLKSASLPAVHKKNQQLTDNFLQNQLIIYIVLSRSLSLKRLFLLAALLTAVPAQATRHDFGQGAAAVACVMLQTGYSQRQVYAVLDRLDSQIRNSPTPYIQEAEMVEGFNYEARNNHPNCPLRISY